MPLCPMSAESRALRGFLLVQDWLDCIRTGRRDNRNTARGMTATLQLIDALFESEYVIAGWVVHAFQHFGDLRNLGP